MSMQTSHSSIYLHCLNLRPTKKYSSDIANYFPQNPSNIYNSDGIYDILLVVETNQGCRDTIIKTITIYPLPTAGFSINATELKANEVIYFTDASIGVSGWTWNFGDNSFPATSANPQHIYNQEGTYLVVQIVENNYTCLDTAKETVVITGDDIFPPRVPTGFSPNGDGINDVLLVKGGPFISIDFKVYNKWGELIFTTTDPNTGWDGSRNGAYQPLGMYAYTIKAVTIDNKEYTKTGDIKLIR